MKTRTITPLLLFLSCVTIYACAQPPRLDSPAEATVRALDNEERIAALNQDFAALERLWSEHFIVNAPSNQILPNRAAVLDWFRQGMTTRSSYERVIEQIRVDGDIAIVMGEEILTPTANAPHAGHGAPPLHQHLEEGRRSMAFMGAARQLDPGATGCHTQLGS
ncbi:MAG: nuclear transport factor 2 family protein [Longimicrobiales bacterium]